MPRVFAEGPGWQVLIGDSTSVMAEMPDKQFDLCLTDPPYGVGMASNKQIGNGQRTFPRKAWDTRRPHDEAFNQMVRVSRHQIIWGGNYFADLLDPSRCWLVWYKRPGISNSFADCELAWTSLNQNARVFVHLWNGSAKAEKEPIYAHPTQKPRRLFSWCLTQPKVRPTSVLDPFLGSGTTLETCLRAGIPVVGIDQDEEYCEIAAKRAESVVAEIRSGDGLTELPKAA